MNRKSISRLSIGVSVYTTTEAVGCYFPRQRDLVLRLEFHERLGIPMAFTRLLDNVDSIFPGIILHEAVNLTILKLGFADIFVCHTCHECQPGWVEGLFRGMQPTNRNHFLQKLTLAFGLA